MPSGNKKRSRDEDDDLGQENTGLGNQSLPVAILPDDFDGIPQDGAQYLAVVRKEAKAAPSIVRDENYLSHDDNSRDTNLKLPSFGGAQSSVLSGSASKIGIISEEDAESQFLPSQSWRENFAQKFRNMHESIKRKSTTTQDVGHSGLPNSKSAIKWFRFLHGIGPDLEKFEGSLDEEEGVEMTEESRHKSNKSLQFSLRMPISSLLQRFKLVQIMFLLSSFTIWLDEDWYQPVTLETTEGVRPAIEAFHSKWLFALLAHLDERLVGDDMSTLRQLARSCIARIARSRAMKPEKGLSAIDMESEQGAWIVICAIIEVWGQRDLWQDAENVLR